MRRTYFAVFAGMAAVVVTLAVARQDKGLLPKDNSACIVCHANFEKETLAASHLKNGVTCARCHGRSVAHMDDEEAATKPDVLFGRTEIEKLCRECHKAHKNPSAVAKFLAEWKGKRRPHRRLILKDSVCTDCHFEHRIPRGGPGG